MTVFFSRRLLTATRYAIFEQGRNRLALGLLLVFVPFWYYLFRLLIQGMTLPFKYWDTGHIFLVPGDNLSLLTAGLNAITLIVGFMFFASTTRGMAFDRRLVLGGYPQAVLVLGKLLALLIVTALVALYATLILFAFWRYGHPMNLALVWLCFWCAALIYGGFGLLLGVLVTNELAGFFLIIMVSLLDTGFQNPFGNPLSNQPLLKVFPSFAAMQLGAAGGFTTHVPWQDIAISLAWFASFSVLGLLIFWRRTHARHVQVAQSPIMESSFLHVANDTHHT